MDNHIGTVRIFVYSDFHDPPWQTGSRDGRGVIKVTTRLLACCLCNVIFRLGKLEAGTAGGLCFLSHGLSKADGR